MQGFGRVNGIKGLACGRNVYFRGRRTSTKVDLTSFGCTFYGTQFGWGEELTQALKREINFSDLTARVNALPDLSRTGVSENLAVSYQR